MSQATLVGKYHKKLGTRIHINPRVIGGVFYAVLLLAPALLLGKTELDRIRPFLDLVKHSGLVAGKLIGSVKNRVIVI